MRNVHMMMKRIILYAIFLSLSYNLAFFEETSAREKINYNVPFYEWQAFFIIIIIIVIS